MKLVVGLGNPGREYIGTRHNIGFEVVDRLAEILGWIRPGTFNDDASSRFHGLALEGPVSHMVMDGELASEDKLVLMKPTTYMNESGRAVQAALAFYKASPADALIVLDDLALPCGKLRLRASGTSGGHNGLKDIERALGSQEYPRLRLGIDPPPPPVPGKQYVLGRFGVEQRKLMDPAVDRAARAAATWAESGIVSAMNKFNADGDKN
jgi:PTH1 family peptidyl-tRNA hydrolase